MDEAVKLRLLERWEDQREIKNLMGRFSAAFTVKEERTIYASFWSAREDVCLGVNNGWYLGAAEVEDYYSWKERRIRKESQMIGEAFPKVLGDKTPEELHGVGLMSYRPVDTPVIEVAEDGETAKGLWCVRGSSAVLTEAGPVSYWEWGWFAVDFIREAGAWKIWNMLDLTELSAPCGSVWSQKPPEHPERPEFAGVKALTDKPVTMACTLHELYSPKRAFADPPRLPQPYRSFAETFSYGWSGEEESV